MRHQALRSVFRGGHALLRPKHSARTPSLCAASRNRTTPILNRNVPFSTSSSLLSGDKEIGQFISKGDAFAYYCEHVDNEMTEAKFQEVAKKAMQVIFQAFAHGQFDDIEDMMTAKELARWRHKFITVKQSEKKKIMDYWDNMDRLFIRPKPAAALIYSGSDSPAVDPRNTKIVLHVAGVSHNVFLDGQQSSLFSMLKHGLNDILFSSRYGFDVTFTVQADPEEANWLISRARVYSMKGMEIQKEIL